MNYIKQRGIDIDMIQIEVDFELYRTRSQSLKHYNYESDIYRIFSDALTDMEFLLLVLFNNDKFEIPPTSTFCRYYEISDLTDFEKRSIGDWFRVLFMNVFRYEKKKRKRITNALIENTLVFLP